MIGINKARPGEQAAPRFGVVPVRLNYTETQHLRFKVSFNLRGLSTMNHGVSRHDGTWQRAGARV